MADARSEPADTALLTLRLQQYKQAAVYYKRQADLVQARAMLVHVRNIQDALEKLEFVREQVFSYADVRDEYVLPPPLPPQILDDLQRIVGSNESATGKPSGRGKSSAEAKSTSASLNTANRSDARAPAILGIASLLDLLDTQIASCTAASAYYYAATQKTQAVVFHRHKKQLLADRDMLAPMLQQQKSATLPQIRYQDISYQIENAFTDLPMNELQIAVVRAIGLHSKEAGVSHISSYVSWDIGGYPEDGQGRGDTHVVYKAMNPEYNVIKNIKIDRNRTFQRHLERKKATFEVFHRGDGILGLGLLAKNVSLGKVLVKLDRLLNKSEINEVADILDSNRRATGSKLEYRIRLRQPLLKQDIETRNESWVFIDSWSPVSPTSSRSVEVSLNKEPTIPKIQPMPISPERVPTHFISPITSPSSNSAVVQPVSPIVSLSKSPTIVQPLSSPVVASLSPELPPTQPSASISNEPVNADLEAAEAWLEEPENIVSNLVLEHELTLTRKQIVEATKAKNTTLVQELDGRKDLLDSKLMMLQINVSSGILTMDDYAQQLEAAIKFAKEQALMFKRNNRLDLAKQTIARTQLMQKEIDEIKEMLTPES